MPGRNRAKVTLAIAWNKFCVTGYHFSSALKASQEQSAEVAAAPAAAWAVPLLSGLLSSFSSYLFNWPLICFYFKQSLLVWSIGFHLRKQRQLSRSPLAVLSNSRRLCSRQRVGERLSRAGQSCHKSSITFTSLNVFFFFLNQEQSFICDPWKWSDFKFQCSQSFIGIPVCACTYELSVTVFPANGVAERLQQPTQPADLLSAALERKCADFWWPQQSPSFPASLRTSSPHWTTVTSEMR